MVLDEIENAAGKDSGRSQQYADLQEPADDGFEAAIVHMRLQPSP